MSDIDQVTEVESLYAQLHDLLDRIDAVDVTPALDSSVLAAAEQHERAYRRMYGIGHRRMMDCNDRGVAGQLGYRHIGEVMEHHLRMPDHRRRLKHMRALAQFRSLQGELTPPRYPTLAAVVADGAAAPAHVDAVVKVLKKIPMSVPLDVAEKAEAMMAEFARTLTPKQILKAGAELLGRIDPDGTLADERDRARRRSVLVADQDDQSMSEIEGALTPKARAMLDVILAKMAAPGMNNPDDDQSPRGANTDADIAALKEAAGRDHRSTGQRNHDALEALFKLVLDGGVLGKSHRGLPPHIIVKVNEADLRDRAGFGHTATGTQLPMSDIIEMAAEAQFHLAVFKDHTAEPLYLGTAKRLASRAQRLMLFAQDGGGGCSKPGCPRPSAIVEIHHADKDWADGGTTDIDMNAPACPPHNRMVGPKPGQWTTRIIREGRDAGRAGWSLNPLDGSPPGPPQVNRVHEVGELFEHYLRNGTISEEPQAAEPEPPPSAAAAVRRKPIPPARAAASARRRKRKRRRTSHQARRRLLARAR
ncbi:DUF222 domain-containing protein [Gordonia sp. HNM0687]|uniref:DUF222 domain-containing protein n=1 Tax=Gordonia mangrovi TaxID=2665643 RepID=A0A6L7GJ85_9ACTN|nr:HNH endonuclease signature motif containing protein [Gordonia mangrovi]MXP19926.1 DUF222 domain-containing protein [Gordonia mangrovi]UVF79453.1 HNH endonuclease [Gordonia mangrovi]